MAEVLMPKKKEKGGLFGKIARIGGAVGGLAAAPFTGGASIGIGQAIGQGVGALGDAAEGKANPLAAALTAGQAAGSAASSIGDMNKSNALKTAADANPEVQKAGLLEARKATAALPKPDRDQLLSQFDQAISALDEADQIGQGVGLRRPRFR